MGTDIGLFQVGDIIVCSEDMRKCIYNPIAAAHRIYRIYGVREYAEYSVVCRYASYLEVQLIASYRAFHRRQVYEIFDPRDVVAFMKQIYSPSNQISTSTIKPSLSNDSKELVHMKATHKARDVDLWNDVKYFPETDSLDILRDNRLNLRDIFRDVTDPMKATLEH